MMHAEGTSLVKASANIPNSKSSLPAASQLVSTFVIFSQSFRSRFSTLAQLRNEILQDGESVCYSLPFYILASSIRTAV